MTTATKETKSSAITLSDEQRLTIESLETEALRRGSPAVPLTIGLGAGLSAIGLGLPVFAIGACTAPFLLRAFLKANEAGRVDEYIHSTGIFCHQLSTKQIARFISVFGDNAGHEIVVAHLVKARSEGQPLSSDAQRLLTLINEVPEEITIEAIAKRINPPESEVLGKAEMDMIMDATEESSGDPDTKAQTIYYEDSEPAPSFSVNPSTGTEFVHRLKQECYPMYKLLSCPPIRLFGKQRTGKTTLAKKLSLARMVAIPGHKVHAVTPHYEPGNPYPSSFKTFGFSSVSGQRKGQEIAHQWLQYAARNDKNIHANLTTLWDEFGAYGDFIEEDDLGDNLASMLRESSKRQEFPIFLLHGETAKFLPGGKGMVTVFNSGTVRVETIGELVENSIGLEEMRPTGRFTVDFGDGETMEGKVPDWLTEEYLLSLLEPTAGEETPKPHAKSEKTLGFDNDENSYNLSRTGSTQEVISAWRLGATQKELLRKFWGLTNAQIESHCDEFQDARAKMRLLFLKECECNMANGFISFKMFTEEMPC